MKIIPITEIAVFDDEWNWQRFRQKKSLDEEMRVALYESHAAYILWHENPKKYSVPAVYIGSTGAGKCLRNRLATHKRKLVDSPKYAPINWRRYRSEWDYEISDFFVGFFRCQSAEEAIHAEACLLAHHFIEFRRAPQCNAQYKDGYTYKGTMNKILESM